jgi:hypothetical protein
MFARDKRPVDATPDETPAPQPRQKVQPKDAKAFRPSSFATRRAQADKANRQRAVPRIASLGKSDHMQRNRQGGVDVLEVEQFYDIDHPARRFVAFPGYRMTPTSEDRRDDEVTPLGTVRGRRLHRPETSAFEPPLPDQPPRPVA